jgi:multidrug efflux pump subunit AcrA (membrane-fusion protein)
MNLLQRSGRPSVWIVGLIVLASFGSGCERRATQDAASGDAAAPVVDVVSPTRQSLVRLIEQPGYVKAYEQTPIYSKIAGFIEKINVDINDRVKKGDLLIELSVPEMEQDLKAREARVVASAAEVRQTEEGLKAADANINTYASLVQEANAGVSQAVAEYQRWQAEYDRGKRLLGDKVFDKQTVDELLSQLQQAAAGKEKATAKVVSSQAALVESKAKREKAVADVEAARAKLLLAEAEKNQSAAWLEYRNIRAPYDGVVTLRNVNTGDFLQSSSSGSTNKSASPSLVVMRSDVMRITFQVPEYDAVLVKEGMPATIHFPATPSKDLTGAITRFSWSFDEQARTLKAEIHVPNPKLDLRPGMYANIAVRAKLDDAMTLPSDSLTTDGEKTFCFIVEEGRAVRTAVKVGVQAEKRTQVLGKQQKPDSDGKESDWQEFTGRELIVARNPQSLVDGQAVTVAAGKAR